LKAILQILLLIGINSISFAQFPGSVDSLYIFIKYNSIHRNTFDWDEIDVSFRDRLSTAQSLNDTMQCFVFVLERLNDVHSQIYLNNQFYGHYPVFDDTTLSHIKPLNDKAKALTNQIYTSLIADKFAYIRIPSMVANSYEEINQLAQSLHDSISQFSSKKVEGFVLDLRLNGGGNIYPMLSGLSPFLGDNIVGYETDIADEIIRTWEIRNGNFVIGGYQSTQITVSATSQFQTTPVVVLIGPVTKSSGSMVAIAFKDRPNTFFIGEPSANGYTTSNGYFQFAPNLNLNFATSFVADRNKHIYKATVNPDIKLYGGDNFEDLEKDVKVISAIKWFSQKSNH